jgi:hypothetical protein
MSAPSIPARDLAAYSATIIEKPHLETGSVNDQYNLLILNDLQQNTLSLNAPRRYKGNRGRTFGNLLVVMIRVVTIKGSLRAETYLSSAMALYVEGKLSCNRLLRSHYCRNEQELISQR